MKIELEKLFLIILLVSLISLSLLLVTPISDNYLHYTIARQILRDTGFLWRSNMTAGTSFLVSNEAQIFNYPPLLHLTYALLFLFNLPPYIIDIISLIVVSVLIYKLDKKALPFMFLSWLFIRISVQGGIDIFLLALTTASIYFFDKKPVISGVFAGLTLIVKGTAFLFFGGWLISILLFKKNELFNKNFYKSKFFIAILLAILISSTWYLRNFVLFKGDLIATLVGISSSGITKSTVWMNTGIQANQPERQWFDTSGFYPLPIDLLFYIGIAFTIFNLYKNRKIEKEHIFIGVFALTYIIVQAIQFNFLMTIRLYLPIFPLLAIQVKKGIPEKYLKFAYLGCLVFLMFFMLNLPKYDFNQMDSAIGPVCSQIKENIDFQPVYVNAYQNWYVIYKCDLNATTQIDSKWTLDFDKGQLYLTNKTNITGK